MLCCAAAVDIVERVLRAKLADSEVAGLLAGLAAFRAGPRTCDKDGDDESLSVLANILPESVAPPPPPPEAEVEPGGRKRRSAAAGARAAVAAVAADLEDDSEEEEAAAAGQSGDEAESGSDAEAPAGPRCVLGQCDSRTAVRRCLTR